MENTSPKKKHTLLKWVLGIIITIVLLAGATAWYLNEKWKPLLTTEIENSIIDATDSLYRVKFTKIQVNILSGGVIVDSVEITPDLRIYKKLIDKRIAPENLFSINLSKLSLKQVNPLKVYRERKLVIENITIQDPSLSIFYTKLPNKLKKAPDNRTPYQKLKSVLDELKIGSIFLNDVKFKYVDQSLKKTKTTFLDRMNIRINDILIDSISQNDSTRIFNAKDIIAEISDYDFATPDSMYHLHLKHAFISTLKKQLIISGAGLIPRYTDMAFSRQFEKQQESYRLTFDSIMVDNLNFNNLIDSRTVKSDKITIKNGELAVFLNREKPVKNIDKGKNFPHLALQRVPWDIIVDTTVIKNINVSYSEYNPKTEAKGTIHFNGLKGTIFNVTNDSASLSNKNIANAYLETMLMGKGKINVHIAFNLSDPKGGFSYDGKLGSMPTSAINSITIPLAMVKTSSGQVHGMDFNIKGNVDGAGGTLTLRYDDLNVILMKKDEAENFKKMGLISLFANALLVNNANPKGNNPLTVAHPYYARPPEGSFFNLMWKTIFQGLKQSIGISKDKEAKLTKRAENFKDAKAARERRKQERQKRREERKKE
ncbi:MAG: hypothetical protein ABIP95_15685 [Pelobium sp.]